MHELNTGVNADITFTKTAIGPKFFNRCFLKICSAASDRCTIKSRISCTLKTVEVVQLRGKFGNY